MPTTLLNTTNTVQSNSSIKLEIVSSQGSEGVYFFESDDSGNFSLSIEIPQELENQTVDFVYTNTKTGETKTILYAFPALSTIPLSISFTELIYKGEGSYGSYRVFPGVAVSGSLTSPSSTEYASLSKDGIGGAGGEYGITFPLDVSIPTGEYTAAISAPGYIGSVSTVMIVKDGLKAELITEAGLRFPGDSHSIYIKGKAGSTVNVEAFNANYLVTLDSNGEAKYTITIPNSASFGTENAIVSSSEVPFNVLVGLRVDNPADYALTADLPEQLITNNQNNPNSAIFGLALPGKEVTLTIPTFNTIDTAIADPFGTYQISIPTLPWTPSGDFTLTVSANGENTISGSGTHKSDVQLVSSVGEAFQGSSSQAFQIRADANSNLVLSIPGFINDEVFIADEQGYATLNFPSIPLETQVPTSVFVSIGYISEPLYSNSFNVNISERVPITINITNSPTLENSNSSENILFINSTYSISGTSPSNTRILTLSAIGDVASLERTSYENDTYAATLVTGLKPTLLTITASTILQPSFSKSYIVTYHIQMSIPQVIISYENTGFQVIISTGASIAVTLEIFYQDEDSKTLFTKSFTNITDNNGNFTCIIDFDDIKDATQIEFQAFTENAYRVNQIRTYENRIGRSTLSKANNQNLVAIIPTPMFGSNAYVSVAEDNLSHKAYISVIEKSIPNTLTEQSLTENSSFFYILCNRLYRYKFFLEDNTFFINNNSFTFFFGIIPYQSNNPYLIFAISSKIILKIFTASSDIIFEDENFIYPFNFAVVTDFAVVYINKNPDNNNNSTVIIYINGIEIIKKNYTEILNTGLFSGLTFANLGHDNTASGQFGIASSQYLYNKAFTSQEIAEAYNNGIRKKLRRSNVEDFAKNLAFSVIPGENDVRGYYEIQSEKFALLPIKSQREGNIYFVDNPLQPIKDSEGRNYFSLKNTPLECGKNSLNSNLLFIIKRKNFTNKKQVLFDCRLSLPYASAYEIAFTAANKITLTVNINNSFTKIVFTSELLVTSDILCLFFRVFQNGSNNQCFVNGVEASKEIFATSNPGDLNRLDNQLTIGGKYERTNLLKADFYGMFNLEALNNSVSSNVSLEQKLGSRGKLIAYYALCCGFKEPMLQVDPNFSLLNKRDGFLYI